MQIKHLPEAFYGKNIQINYTSPFTETKKNVIEKFERDYVENALKKLIQICIKPKKHFNNHEVHEDHEDKVNTFSSSTFVVFVVR